MALVTRRLTARISGGVQGVGYRYFARDQAQRLGLRGFVRNLTDGGVELVAEGAEHDLRELLDRLRAGPPYARVGQVRVAWSDPTGDLPQFAIRATTS
jgi:acylphosphatase